ncbi:MAG: hypothetical protein EXR72_24265 [Myxococcales bacterium]|nr:hypothetical protein [Myxococcales bacterium]
MGSGHLSRAAALAAMIACGGCATTDPGRETRAAAVAFGPSVATIAEAQAASGKVVRVTGKAQREKLGDSVDTPGLSVICMGPRFPDDRIGQTVTAEGTIELTEELQATVGPNGEISQGTEPGTSSWVLRRCTLR